VFGRSESHNRRLSAISRQRLPCPG
jgi:hypothetical protein